MVVRRAGFLRTEYVIGGVTYVIGRRRDLHTYWTAYVIGRRRHLCLFPSIRVLLSFFGALVAVSFLRRPAMVTRGIAHALAFRNPAERRPPPPDRTMA